MFILSKLSHENLPRKLFFKKDQNHEQEILKTKTLGKGFLKLFEVVLCSGEHKEDFQIIKSNDSPTFVH